MSNSPLIGARSNILNAPRTYAASFTGRAEDVASGLYRDGTGRGELSLALGEVAAFPMRDLYWYPVSYGISIVFLYGYFFFKVLCLFLLR